MISLVHTGKSLSTLPHADDEGRPTKFRGTEEQGMPPAKHMCKQATKHGRHEHRQDRHGRREHRQGRHDHLEPRRDHHSRREHRQGRHDHLEPRRAHHSHREDRQDRHSHHEDRQDRHSHHEDRQDRHSHHEDRQDRHSHHEDRQDRHSHHEDRQDRHSHHEDRQDHHSHHEDRQDRHSRREDRQDCHGRHEHRQDCHSHHEDREDHHGRHEHRHDCHSHREDCQDCQDRQDRHGRYKHRREHYGHYKHHQNRCARQSREHYDHHLPPTCRKTPHQQPHYQSHYQMPLESTSQSSPRPSPDSPREKYALFLRDYYTRHQTPCTKWPPLNIANYINLAVIGNEYANRKDLVKFREQTIRGSIDDILDWKAPIRMEDILKPNCAYSRKARKQTQFPVTQLLIEGAPGIGKSTFAWEVCQKWGQHQLFNEYSLVVLLKFRDKRVQESKNISDLFYYPLPELESYIVQDIVLSGGHGLLLILEGFDEAPASKRSMDSIFVRLFTGQELPKATVILTTRPSASAELRQFCNSVNSRRIEIVGFGKKEIDEYIQCAFSGEQSRLDFIEYLSLYPYIHSMMYVPLNSAIVTHVYESCKSSGVVVPKTMTQLYSSLIRTLLLRYLKDKEEYKHTCTNINSFRDLPPPVYDRFCEICKIAYTGIMSAETELIFQDLPSDFDTLGLMQTCPELYVDRGASVSYNFLHLTVQEYLAAYHISQQSRDEQVAFMNDNIKFLREREHTWQAFMGDLNYKKLKVVVRFLAGLTELGRDLWNVVSGFACTDKRNIRTKFFSNEKNFIKLEILHLLFESQNSSVITSALGSDCMCFDCGRAQQPFDWYVLGYCIAHSSCDWKLELEECKLELVELFLKALNLHQDQCQLSPTGKIKEVWLGESDPAAAHLLVENMPQKLVFLHLSLEMCKLTSQTCNLLCKHNLQHLEYMNLSNNPNIGRGGAVNLITSLTKFSTIRDLDLCRTGIGFEDCKALSELLATSKYIKVLNISANMLLPDSIQMIVDGLSHNTSLEKLDVSNSFFSSENMLHLASVLRENTRLKDLDILQCNIGVEGALELIESLKHNTTLKKLKLSKKCKPPSFSTLDITLQERIQFFYIPRW